MIKRLFNREQRAIRDPAWDGWARADDLVRGASNTYAGVRINPTESLEAAPVLGCQTLISDIMATMPVRQFNKKTGKDAASMVTWLDEPQRATDWPTWIFDTTMGWIGDGELFLVPLRIGGMVTQIAAIDANRVTVSRQNPGADVVYSIDGTPYTGELIHRIKWRRKRYDLRGVPVVELAKEAVGAAIAAQRYGGSFFGQSAIPPVVLELTGNPTPTQMKEIRESWMRHHAGPSKAHLPGILLNGSAKQIMVSPEQAQFLQTRRFVAAEIATNLFHLPPETVGVGIDGSSVTYHNLETRWSDIIRSGVMPWMTRYEAVLRRFLPDGDEVCFLPDKYQQADLLTQYQTLEIGVRNDIITTTEARHVLNMVGDAPVKPPVVAPSVPPIPEMPPGGGK
jgi:HK97 family phage portal protein